MTTIFTIRERDTGFATYAGAAASARRPTSLAACNSADQLIKLALMAANASIWLYVTAALGLAA